MIIHQFSDYNSVILCNKVLNENYIIWDNFGSDQYVYHDDIFNDFSYEYSEMEIIPIVWNDDKKSYSGMCPIFIKQEIKEILLQQQIEILKQREQFKSKVRNKFFMFVEHSSGCYTPCIGVFDKYTRIFDGIIEYNFLEDCNEFKINIYRPENINFKLCHTHTIKKHQDISFSVDDKISFWTGEKIYPWLLLD